MDARMSEVAKPLRHGRWRRVVVVEMFYSSRQRLDFFFKVGTLVESFRVSNADQFLGGPNANVCTRPGATAERT
jgi:hypothetical protein